jgi:hypothetical protein
MRSPGFAFPNSSDRAEVLAEARSRLLFARRATELTKCFPAFIA